MKGPGEQTKAAKQARQKAKTLSGDWSPSM
jgi:hypothetical protein